MNNIDRAAISREIPLFGEEELTQVIVCTRIPRRQPSRLSCYQRTRLTGMLGQRPTVRCLHFWPNELLFAVRSCRYFDVSHNDAVNGVRESLKIVLSSVPNVKFELLSTLSFWTIILFRIGSLYVGVMQLPSELCKPFLADFVALCRGGNIEPVHNYNKLLDLRLNRGKIMWVSQPIHNNNGFYWKLYVLLCA